MADNDRWVPGLQYLRDTMAERRKRIFERMLTQHADAVETAASAVPISTSGQPSQQNTLDLSPSSAISRTIGGYCAALLAMNAESYRPCHESINRFISLTHKDQARYTTRVAYLDAIEALRDSLSSAIMTGTGMSLADVKALYVGPSAASDESAGSAVGNTSAPFNGAGGSARSTTVDKGAELISTIVPLLQMCIAGSHLETSTTCDANDSGMTDEEVDRFLQKLEQKVETGISPQGIDRILRGL